MLAVSQARNLWVEEPKRGLSPTKPKERIRARAAFVGLAILAFVVALTWTVQSVLLLLKGYELARLQKEILNLKQANQQLELEVTRLKSPERVAKLATTRLGMVKPQAKDVQFSAVPSREVQMAEQAQPAASPKEALSHSFWVKVGQVLERWFTGSRPAEAADR